MTAAPERRRVRVAARREVATDVVALDLAPADGAPLPDWEPGAHVDLEVVPGTERQYSLVATTPEGHWRIAVLREPDGRGGSVAVHEALTVGAEVVVAGPRNHFGFDPTRPAVFVAGGIGITPLVAMIDAAERAGTPWELHYAGRSRSRMAFVDELVAAHPDRVAVAAADEHPRLHVSDSSPNRGTPSCTAAVRADSWTRSRRPLRTGPLGASGSSGSNRPPTSTPPGNRSRSSSPSPASP